MDKLERTWEALSSVVGGTLSAFERMCGLESPASMAVSAYRRMFVSGVRSSCVTWATNELRDSVASRCWVTSSMTIMAALSSSRRTGRIVNRRTVASAPCVSSIDVERRSEPEATLRTASRTSSLLDSACSTGAPSSCSRSIPRKSPAAPFA